MSVTLALAFGLLLGTSVLARDLAEGRLGFYFAQPVAGLAIWAGKMSAAMALALTAAGLPLAVALLAGSLPGSGGHGVGDDIGLAIVAGLVATSVVLGHAGSIIVRSRSRWQVVDVIGLVLVAVGGWWSIGTLAGAWAAEALVLVVKVVLVTPPVALLLAGAVQTVGGRADLARGHRLLSLTLWSVLGGVTLLLVVGTSWLVTPKPSEIIAVHAVTAEPSGTWVAIGGSARGRGDLVSTFLIDTASGRWLRMRSQPWARAAVLFAADGRRAAVLVPSRKMDDPRQDLALVDLGAAQPSPQSALINVPPAWGGGAIAMAPDGESVAVVVDGTVTVSALPDGRILAAVRLPVELRLPDLVFTASDTVRLYGRLGDEDAPGELWIGELDVATHRLVATGSIPVGERYRWRAKLDPSFERLLLWQSGTLQTAGATVHDARSGALLEDLGRDGWIVEQGAIFLADGGVLVSERGMEANRLRVVGRDGGERIVELPTAGQYRFGGEIEPGAVLVASTSERWAEASAWRTARVDLDSGALREVGQGFPGSAWSSGIGTTPAPGSVATRLLGTGSAVELIDPASLAPTVVAGSR